MFFLTPTKEGRITPACSKHGSKTTVGPTRGDGRLVGIGYILRVSPQMAAESFPWLGLRIGTMSMITVGMRLGAWFARAWID